MARWLTHKEIRVYLHDALDIDVTEATVILYGKNGYFGPSDGGKPRRYLWTNVKKGATNIPDDRVKLTQEQAEEIFTAKGESNAALARRYGVHPSYVSKIRNGQRRVTT